MSSWSDSRSVWCPAIRRKSLFDGASVLEAKLIAVRDPLINFKISASEDSLAYAPGIDAKLAFLSMGVAGFADSAPTESQYQQFDKLKKQTDELLARWDEVRNADIPNFQKTGRGTECAFDLRARREE